MLSGPSDYENDILHLAWGERETGKEALPKRELFFICPQGSVEIFSGYGLTTQPGSKEHLVGLVMVDRPRPADPEWLKQIENTFGEYQLMPMTANVFCKLTSDY